MNRPHTTKSQTYPAPHAPHLRYIADGQRTSDHVYVRRLRGYLELRAVVK